MPHRTAGALPSLPPQEFGGGRLTHVRSRNTVASGTRIALL